MDTEGAETAGIRLRCAGCGSGALRPARSRGAWQRWIRSMSSAERYACEACGHRGWRLGKLEERPDAQAATAPPRGQRARPPRRGAWRQSLQATLLALLLGAVAALLILRTGAGPR